MLSNKQLEENKEQFLSLLSQITREGSAIDQLIESLTNSDFFDAPASTQFHAGYRGGLCEHSLNVYKNIVKLNEVMNTKYDNETLIIVSLLHDLSKTNFYESVVRKKQEKDGNWISYVGYKVREAKDRFLCYNHSVNSAFMVNEYIPLEIEELSAIMNHHGAFDDTVDKNELSCIFNRYSLAALLHTADLLSTYINEKI